MNRFAMTTFALAIGLTAAPRVWAQSSSTGQVCRDGTVMRSNNTSACILHGGIDQQATSRTSRGVYGTNGTTSTPGPTGNRGVYNGGGVNGSNRQIYTGGNQSGVYDGTRSRDDEHRWDKKHKHHVKKDKKWKHNDRDDDRRDRASHDRDRDDRERDRYRASDNRR
jgi:hypothetical protein